MKDHPFYKELAEVRKDLKKIHDSLLGKPDKISKKDIINNKECMKLLDVSSGTLANWRKQGKIAFSQVNNRIYYKMTDIKKMMRTYYKSSGPIK